MALTRSRSLIVATTLALSTAATVAAAEGAHPASPGPKASTATRFAVFNGSLRDLPVLRATKRKRTHPREAFGGVPERSAAARRGADHRGAYPEESSGPSGGPDASSPSGGEAPTPASGVSFQGMTRAQTGFVPPDTNGDVGPNHYIQTVNVAFEIFNKTGTSLAGPTSINQLWVAAGAGGLCQANNRGDPVVLYDDLADRWLITQFAFGVDAMNNRVAPYAQCAAVSQTPDPVNGGWFLYEFPAEDSTAGDLTTAFPDYPKWGVWSDGYYFSSNEVPGGAGVYAVNRTAMLAGQANPEQIYFEQAGEEFFLPADADGTTAPPAGAPEYFAEIDDAANQIQIYEFDADFTTPANSTFTQTDTIPVAAFDGAVCAAGGVMGNCIPQPGQTGTFWLEALAGERLMHRLQYRNFGTHETLVASHTIDATGSDQAGMRWYELRQPGGTWTLQQQGTQAPDAVHRWMGSIAMDTAGNIGIAYSVSDGASVFPGVRYTHQDAGDPAGTMEAEQTLINGAAAQTCTFNVDTDMDGTPDFCRNRWGDYTSISVDPSDACTFWITNEYIPASGSWETQIGAFDICQEATIQAAPDPIDFGSEDVGEIGLPQTLTVTNIGDADLVISNVSKLGANPADFLVANDNCEGATVPPSGTCNIDLRFAPSGGGPRAATLRISSNATNDPVDVELTGIGLAPAPPSGNCHGVPVTVGGATPGDDVIEGTSGHDVIRGDAGDDVIRSLDGQDTVCGEDGNDQLLTGSQADTAFGQGGVDRINTGNGSDTARGGLRDDKVGGGGGGDALFGQRGPDDLLGRGGPDDLHGGPKSDRCNGGGGSAGDTSTGCERNYLIP